MKPKALHTFVITAYGESPFLEDCIKSLLRQTAETNIILTTSTPSDFLSKMSSKYSIPLLVNSETKGIAADWDFAYRSCTTAYVTIAHQDDIYYESYTETVLEYSETQGGGDMQIFFSGYKEILGSREREISINSIIKALLLLPFNFKSRIRCRIIKKLVLIFGNPISCPTVTYNKKFLGDFEFSKDYKYNLDWEAWLRLAGIKGSFVYSDKRLLLHRLHEDSETSRQISDSNRRKETKRIFRSIWGFPVGDLLALVFTLGEHSNRVR